MPRLHRRSAAALRSTAAGGRCRRVLLRLCPAMTLRGSGAALPQEPSSALKSCRWSHWETGLPPTPRRSTRVRASTCHTPRCAPHPRAAAFVRTLDALAAAERDKAASHGRHALAAQVRCACDSVQDGLVERDTEVRCLGATTSRNASESPRLALAGPAAAACCAEQRAPVAHWEAWHCKKRARPKAQVWSFGPLMPHLVHSRALVPSACLFQVAFLSGSSHPSLCPRSCLARLRFASLKTTDTCAKRNGTACQNCVSVSSWLTWTVNHDT